MTNLREKPLRLEAYLTRDYINQAQKMKEIEQYMRRRVISPTELVAYWVLFGIILTVIILVYGGVL